MRVIGLTGGVGSGKSLITEYLENKYEAHIVRADEIGHILINRDGVCYGKIVELLGEEILAEDMSIDRKKMSSVIFGNDELRIKVNEIIHPAVKKVILDDIDASADAGVETMVIEAALMIEEDYGLLVDELWYVYAPEDVRAGRLKESRNYSDEKISLIMASQASEEQFENYCDYMIDNSGDIEHTYEQIDMLMGDFKAV